MEIMRRRDKGAYTNNVHKNPEILTPLSTLRLPTSQPSSLSQRTVFTYLLNYHYNSLLSRGRRKNEILTLKWNASIIRDICKTCNCPTLRRTAFLELHNRVKDDDININFLDILILSNLLHLPTLFPDAWAPAPLRRPLYKCLAWSLQVSAQSARSSDPWIDSTISKGTLPQRSLGEIVKSGFVRLGGLMSSTILPSFNSIW